ncbi:MAG: hypothetical protein IID44_22070 [Planctomycetes bacterium]|nr:hypothetical protein [Planctomycetota bacterium]
MDGSPHLDKAHEIAVLRRRRGLPASAVKVCAEARRIAWEDRFDEAFALELLLRVEQEKSPAEPPAVRDAVAREVIPRPR